MIESYDDLKTYSAAEGMTVRFVDALRHFS